MQLNLSFISQAINNPKNAQKILKNGMTDEILKIKTSTSSIEEKDTGQNKSNIVENTQNNTQNSKILQQNTSPKQQILNQEPKNTQENIKNLVNSIKENKIQLKEVEKFIKKEEKISAKAPLSDGLNKLIKLTDNDKNLSKLILPLKETIKDIKDLKTNDLKALIEKSGIKYESNIKKFFTSPKLNSNVKEVLKSFSQTDDVNNKNMQINETKENLKQTINNILNKEKVYKEDLKNVKDLVKNITSDIIEKSSLKNIKNIKENIKSLENILKDISSKPIHAKSDDKPKFENLKSDLKHIIQSTIKELKNVEKNILSHTKDIKNTENLTANKDEITKDIKQTQQLNMKNEISQKNTTQSIKIDKTFQEHTSLIKEHANSVKESISELKNLDKLLDVNKLKINLEKNPQTQNNINIKYNFTSQSFNENKNTQNIINQTLDQISTNEQEQIKTQNTQSILNNLATQTQNINIKAPENLNLEDKLKMAVNKLKQVITLSEKTSAQSQNKIDQLNKFSTILDQSINKLPNKDKNESLNNIKNDVKKILIDIQKTTKNSPLPQAKEVFQQASKMINDIEINQFQSLANNSQISQIPLSWQDLKEGNVSFKEGKKEEFYCQISLKFKTLKGVNIMLSLSENKFISANIACEDKNFSNLLKDNLTSLKQSLNSVGLGVLYLGMGVYKNDNLDEDYKPLGMDLKA